MDVLQMFTSNPGFCAGCTGLVPLVERTELFVLDTVSTFSQSLINYKFESNDESHKIRDQSSTHHVLTAP